MRIPIFRLVKRILAAEILPKDEQLEFPIGFVGYSTELMDESVETGFIGSITGVTLFIADSVSVTSTNSNPRTLTI